MGWRSQLTQSIALTTVLAGASFMPVARPPALPTEVRLPLGMVLVVAQVYHWLQQSRRRRAMHTL